MKRFGLPQYTQLVRPWMFGDSNNKAICLWLKGVKPLQPTKIVDKDTKVVRWVHKATGQKNPAASGITPIQTTIVGIDLKHSPESPVLWLTNGVKNKGELTMFSMFKVISIRSGEIRTVYAVDHCARFLIYRDGEWSWNDSKYYIPVEVAG